MFVAFCIAFGRMAAAYRILEDPPDSFQDVSREIAPWEIAGDGIVIQA
jgi:hypothetical protein